MPYKPDVPCADCGKLMWRGTGSLPAGTAVCLGCRRARPAYAERTMLKWPAGCADCGARKPSSRHKYCDRCGKKRRNSTNPAPKLATTTQRGYGSEHRKARAAAVEVFRPGDACARCGEPMLDPVEMLDLDHTDDRAGYLGLSHRSCNRATAGKPRSTYRKVCDGCGAPFDTRNSQQHYCTGACYRSSRKAA